MAGINSQKVQTMLDIESSQRLSILRFPLIVGVVFIHNVDAIVRFENGSIGVTSDNVFTAFIRNLISQNIARTAVPLFFLIAGYFFFRGFQSVKLDYLNRLKSRVRTLLIPFIFWNIATLIVIAVCESLPSIQIYISGAHARVDSFTFYDYINAIFGITRAPISYQFWFIRDLMVLALMSPVIYFFIVRLPLVFIGLLAACWLTGVWPISIPSSDAALFFSIGATVAYKRKSLFMLDKQMMPIVSAYFFTLVAHFLSIGADWDQYLYKISIVLGVLSILCFSKIVALNNRLKELLLGLAGASFFVFAAHEPLLLIARKVLFKLIQPSSSYSILALYFLIPISLIVLLVGVYRVCAKIFPGFTRVVTGGR